MVWQKKKQAKEPKSGKIVIIKILLILLKTSLMHIYQSLFLKYLVENIDCALKFLSLFIRNK